MPGIGDGNPIDLKYLKATRAVALRLDECNTLVRGNFNPYVVTPEWLARVDIWQPEKAEVLLNVLARGLRFRGEGVEWVVDSDRLLVESLVRDCGRVAARVLRLLPHTPVRAVGSNFTFVGDKDDWLGAPVPMLGETPPEAFPEDYRPTQVRWTGSVPGKEVRTEITVVVGDDGIAVQFNFHRQVSTAEAAAAAAEQFARDKDLAVDLLKRLFDREIAS